MKKQTIKLNEEEIERLKAIVRKGQNQARVITRARILLLCHQEKADQEIADTLSVGRATVERIRRRCAREGLESALKEKPRPGQKKILSGRQEAQIIALATSTPPPGHTRWSIRLLLVAAVEQGITKRINFETVRLLLKKTNSNLGASRNGASPK